MPVIKCKMCGGDLNIVEDSSVCECEYCGTKQTVPKVDDEKKLKLFSRAGKLLRSCEFDKASGVFESIVADFPEEAEAYWGLILCKYGIEYVDDPATGKKVPTCHRSSFESVEDDSNFEQACENADAVARRVYREEARQIESLRKRILEVSGKEEPYDVFISYKELDEDGDRTQDSVIAQDIYRTLTKEGYRVFFSRISLEGKLGVEYEPYIFAALNSAKVMIVVGTDYEYFDAVWVKNEWSRFLKLIASGQQKSIIPVYKDMDPYDMPKELRALAAQNMGKIGAMQDLLHGVEKLIGKTNEKASNEQPVIVQGGGPNVTALLGRGFLALEDEDWEKAKELFDQVLNMDFQNADAYLGLAMSEEKCANRDALVQAYTTAYSKCKDNKRLLRARQFGNEVLRQWFEQLDIEAKEAKEQAERIAAEKAQKEYERKRIFANMITAGEAHTVGLKADGTVVATGWNRSGQCKISEWYDIISVTAGNAHTLGLKSDGSVVATGDNDLQQCAVERWMDIVAISAGAFHSVGLKKDGSVIAIGDNHYRQCETLSWTDIKSISAGSQHTVALTSKGTVYAAGSNEVGQCSVSDWKEIVAVAAGSQHTVGLTRSGKVICNGLNTNGQCNTSSWTEIIAVAAGLAHTVGLRSDGRVVAVGNGKAGQCDVTAWTDIIAIAAGDLHTVGLKLDGTVVAVGAGGADRCRVSNWRLFESFDTLSEERREASKRVTNERKLLEEKNRFEKAKAIASLKDERNLIQNDIANLQGLFTGKRRKELEVRLAQIEAELKKLREGETP